MPKKKEHKIIDNIEKKHCPMCDIWKNLNEYNKNSIRWDKLAGLCRDCHNNYKRDKREKNDNYKKYDKEYNETYKLSGRRKEVSRIRYENKKDSILKKTIEYQKNKYNNDPYYRLVFNMRSRVSKVLRQRNIGKQHKIYELLGCSKKEFINYFESKFTEGMTWDQVGKEIHIDHIKPCAKFDLTKKEEQEKCFHYTNLQPLWAKDNLSKGSKYDDNLLNES